MPQDGLGVVVLVIGDHAAPLCNAATANVYERLLGLEQTPWTDRMLAIRLKGKEAGKQARAKAGAGRVEGTKPSHALDDYLGEFEHPAYGVVTIARKDAGLAFDFHKIKLPLAHFHYDRFDTPDDEQDGQWSVNFGTSPQGEIDRALISLDEAEVVFTRRVARELTRPETLRPYAGTYVSPTGAKFEVVLRSDAGRRTRRGTRMEPPWRLPSAMARPSLKKGPGSPSCAATRWTISCRWHFRVLWIWRRPPKVTPEAYSPTLAATSCGVP